MCKTVLTKDRNSIKGEDKEWDDLHQPELPSSKNPQIVNAGEGVERWNPSYTVGEM